MCRRVALALPAAGCSRVVSEDRGKLAATQHVERGAARAEGLLLGRRRRGRRLDYFAPRLWYATPALPESRGARNTLNGLFCKPGSDCSGAAGLMTRACPTETGGAGRRSPASAEAAAGMLARGQRERLNPVRLMPDACLVPSCYATNRLQARSRRDAGPPSTRTASIPSSACMTRRSRTILPSRYIACGASQRRRPTGVCCACW